MRFFTLLIAVLSANAQVPFERILHAQGEPANWLTYSGSYDGARYSRLNQISAANVSRLRSEWVYQSPSLGRYEASPLVVDGILYFTGPNSQVMALDARTGTLLWTYKPPLQAGVPLCCGLVNRGLAVLDDSLYLGTLDAHLIAIDIRTGKPRWNRVVADYKQSYSITAAPLAVKDKVIVGVAGGEFPIRGFLDAYDARTGERAWRFWTIPGPGEPGHETWQGETWKTGGGPTWVTGAYDPEQNAVIWGIGNPAPSYLPDQRPGDNLYSDSFVALDADTGKLKWHFQFTPSDSFDWDACHVPILVERQFQGRMRKLVLNANRNGFFYVLDAESGKFLLGKPYVKQNWASALDSNGRPIRVAGITATAKGTPVYPFSGTNWRSAAYSPQSGFLYVSALEGGRMQYSGPLKPNYFGGLVGGAAAQLEDVTNAEASYTAVRALNPETGNLAWEFKTTENATGGLLSTAGKLVFASTDQGYFYALDANSGKLLWRLNLGARIQANPITYSVSGKQYVAILAGNALFAFGAD